MQKRPKEDFLKILKGYEDLQKSALKIDINNLNDFRNNSESSKNFFNSFKNASERKIELKDFSEDFNENQFKTE